MIKLPPRFALSLFMMLMVSGCASLPEAYLPRNVGSGTPAVARSGIQVSISPDSEVAVKGEPIRFSVVIENVGERAMLIPRRPHILFAWTYANGRRDNLISEIPAEQFYMPRDIIALDPGARMQVVVPIKTYYFERLGITEFHAVVKSPRNINPAMGGVWQGYAMSNRYGVMVTDRRDYAWLR